MKINPLDTTITDSQNKANNREDCSCSKGLCPGVILAALFIGGWAAYSLGTWLWNLLTV